MQSQGSQLRNIEILLTGRVTVTSRISLIEITVMVVIQFIGALGKLALICTHVDSVVINIVRLVLPLRILVVTFLAGVVLPIAARIRRR